VLPKYCCTVLLFQKYFVRNWTLPVSASMFHCILWAPQKGKRKWCSWKWATICRRSWKTQTRTIVQIWIFLFKYLFLVQDLFWICLTSRIELLHYFIIRCTLVIEHCCIRFRSLFEIHNDIYNITTMLGGIQCFWIVWDLKQFRRPNDMVARQYPWLTLTHGRLLSGFQTFSGVLTYILTLFSCADKYIYAGKI